MDPVIQHIRAEYEQLTRDLAAAGENGMAVDMTDGELSLLEAYAERLKLMLTRAEQAASSTRH